MPTATYPQRRPAGWGFLRPDGHAGYDADPETRWPVILFLQGGGERGDGRAELELVLKHGPLKEVWTRQRDLPFVMIAPQMPAYDEDAQRELWLVEHRR